MPTQYTPVDNTKVNYTYPHRFPLFLQYKNSLIVLFIFLLFDNQLN